MATRTVHGSGESWTREDGSRVVFIVFRERFEVVDMHGTRYASLPQARAAYALEPEPPPGSWSFDCVACQTRVHAPVAAMPEHCCRLPCWVPAASVMDPRETILPSPLGDEEDRVVWCVSTHGGSATSLPAGRPTTIAWCPPLAGFYAAAAATVRA